MDGRDKPGHDGRVFSPQLKRTKSDHPFISAQNKGALDHAGLAIQVRRDDQVRCGIERKPVRVMTEVQRDQRALDATLCNCVGFQEDASVAWAKPHRGRRDIRALSSSFAHAADRRRRRAG